MGDRPDCGFGESEILRGIGDDSKNLKKESIRTQGEVTEKKG